MPEILKAERKRRPRARHHSIVVAALQERLNCITQDDVNGFHIVRMNELFDELERSLGGLNGKTEAEESE